MGLMVVAGLAVGMAAMAGCGDDDEVPAAGAMGGTDAGGEGGNGATAGKAVGHGGAGAAGVGVGGAGAGGEASCDCGTDADRHEPRNELRLLFAGERRFDAWWGGRGRGRGRLEHG